jgi:hypothetical protein
MLLDFRNDVPERSCGMLSAICHPNYEIEQSSLAN